MGKEQWESAGEAATDCGELTGNIPALSDTLTTQLDFFFIKTPKAPYKKKWKYSDCIFPDGEKAL